MPEYGSIDEVKQTLQPTITSEWTVDDDARLDRLQQAISAAIEHDLGRTFGAPVADTAKVIFAGPSSVLILPMPARAITSVMVGGTVTGGTVTGGTVSPATDWAHDPVDTRGRILGLRLLSGGWWGGVPWYGGAATPVVIVGDFIDSDDDAAVPDAINEIANFLIAETFKYQSASPAGFLGPDGSTVPIRDPWKDPLVVRTLSEYRTSYRALVV